MNTHNVLGICGSLRSASVNRMLLRNAANQYDDAVYQEADLRLPLYDGDDEDAHGLPAGVQTLCDQISAADAVIIATPEYNKLLSGVLKNALDWVSRGETNVWRDKPVAIVAATAGRTGGQSAASSLRTTLLPFRPLILAGPVVEVAGASREFDAEGTLTNERYVAGLKSLMSDLRLAAAERRT